MSFMTEVFKPVKHNIVLKPKKANIKIACWIDTPEFAKVNKKYSTAQTAGIRYEKRVKQELLKLADSLGFELISHRWIKYNDGSFAQPDFVLVSLLESILFEVKYTWTDTSSQRNHYTNLLKEIGLKSITSCTVCHNLTSKTPRDEIIHIFSDIKQDSIWQLRI